MKCLLGGEFLDGAVGAFDANAICLHCDDLSILSRTVQMAVESDDAETVFVCANFLMFKLDSLREDLEELCLVSGVAAQTRAKKEGRTFEVEALS